ncbi:MAG: hypothetical protein FJY88_02220 [Candidatus Eisenbacteria bacterium]|nr:hypothetical protein [Candidatus Eisenbacteria bacterium]
MVPFFHLVIDDDREFPIDELKRELAKNPLAILHPGRSKPTFVVCSTRGAAARRLVQLLEDPKTPFDTNGMIALDSKVITVFLPGKEDIHSEIEGHLLPLLRKCPCRIVDDSGRDLTAEYRDRYDELFRIP